MIEFQALRFSKDNKLLEEFLSATRTVSNTDLDWFDRMEAEISQTEPLEDLSFSEDFT